MAQIAGKRPSVYLDTTVLSSYWYEGADVLTLAHRFTMREWWESERSNFTLWASSVTEDELRAGHYRRQEAALLMAKRIRFLPITAAVEEFADQLVQQAHCPRNQARGRPPDGNHRGTPD